jgi:hypothetical protein
MSLDARKVDLFCLANSASYALCAKNAYKRPEYPNLRSQLCAHMTILTEYACVTMKLGLGRSLTILYCVQSSSAFAPNFC